MRAKFYLIVVKYKSPYTRREKISLLDLIIFSVLCMIYFSGVYKRDYEILIEYLGLFTKLDITRLLNE
ncbi:transposase [Methanotorris formicicus Mc-S-70]|uniref:Transposase n=1 Tax=Methanotorris formicicus Mc-S-70 TaxID=647171 RepID=H1L0V1_9EURY|nr:transposase [Methanotorris formicicus Mc-S-70]